jgi:hypothetical protein
MVSKAHKSAGTTTPNSAGGSVGSRDWGHLYFDMDNVNIKNRITTVGVIAVIGAMFGAGMLNTYGAALFFVLAVTALPAIRLHAAIKWPLVLVLSLSSCAAGDGVTQARAKKHANEFCERFPVGQELEAAARAASDEGSPRLRRINANEVWVGYTGGTLFDRHFCMITAESGHIVKKDYSYLD